MKKNIGNKIVELLSVDLPSFTVKLKFFDGLSAKVSLKHLFEAPQGLAAEILKGGIFEQCFVEGGALAWPNGFELCPDALRRWLNSQKTSNKTKAA